MAINLTINPPDAATVTVNQVRQAGQERQGNTLWLWNGTVYQLDIQPKTGFAVQSITGNGTVRVEVWDGETLESRTDYPETFLTSAFTQQGTLWTPNLKDLGHGANLGMLPAVSGARNSAQRSDFDPPRSTDYIVQGDVNVTVYLLRDFKHIPVYDTTSGKLCRNVTRGNVVLRDSP